MRARSLLGVLLIAGFFTSLAGVMAQSGGEPPAPSPPAPGSAPADKVPPSPPAESTKQKKDKKETKEEAGPKVVRWVCTDRICGGCDGQCSRHGHVAVRRGGHCACTPEKGSPLDQAIQKAFAGHEKGR